jgi:hypothetical protein
MIYLIQFLLTVLIVLAWHLLAMDGRIDFYIRKMRNRFIDWRTMPKYDAAKVAVDWKYELVGTDFIKRKLAEAQAAIDDKQPDDAVFPVAKQETQIKQESRQKPKAMTAPIIPKGFKRHDGSKKIPVRKTCFVDVLLRDRDIIKDVKAGACFWNHIYGDRDIIAYRLSKRKGFK